MVLTSSAKETNRDFGLSAIGVSFSIVFGVLKTSKARVILSIKVTSVPIPIFSITNGISFGVTSSSNVFT